MAPAFSAMSAQQLDAYEARQRAKVDAGHDDGCREYLLAAVLERNIRRMAAIKGALSGQPERRAA